MGGTVTQAPLHAQTTVFQATRTPHARATNHRTEKEQGKTYERLSPPTYRKDTPSRLKAKRTSTMPLFSSSPYSVVQVHRWKREVRAFHARWRQHRRWRRKRTRHHYRCRIVNLKGGVLYHARACAHVNKNNAHASIRSRMNACKRTCTRTCTHTCTHA